MKSAKLVPLYDFSSAAFYDMYLPLRLSSLAPSLYIRYPQASKYHKYWESHLERLDDVNANLMGI